METSSSVLISNFDRGGTRLLLIIDREGHSKGELERTVTQSQQNICHECGKPSGVALATGLEPTLQSATSPCRDPGSFHACDKASAGASPQPGAGTGGEGTMVFSKLVPSSRCLGMNQSRHDGKQEEMTTSFN